MRLPAAAEGMGACHEKSGDSPAGKEGPFREGREPRKLKKKEIGTKKLLCKRCRKGEEEKVEKKSLGNCGEE